MLQTLCHRLLKLTGWGFTGSLPHASQYIIIVAPHTSNWDFVIGLTCRFALNIKMHFLAKHQLFSPLWGWFFRSVGGAPVDRSKHNNLVEACCQLFKDNPNFKLVLTPEGTRKEVTRWKMGFYHIAKQAQIPIISIGFDYRLKKIMIAKPFTPSNDMTADIKKITDFHRKIHGLNPKSIP